MASYGYQPRPSPSPGRLPRPNPYADNDYDQSNLTLPPAPTTGYSPFDDHNTNTFPYPSPSPSQSYSHGHGRVEYDQVPFEEADAIPMTTPKGKYASETTVSPILPHEQNDPFVRDVDTSKSKHRRQRSKSKDRWFRGQITWVVYVLTTIQLCVFIAEIIKNAVLTKSPIEIHPSFNPMIGPSPYVMINMGSRFDPCMHNVTGIQDRATSAGPILWPCPNATSITPGSDGASCSLHELCGFGAKTDSPAPNQWFRFIIPMFIHAGFVHIGFNLLLQLTLGRDVEKLIGSARFALVYFASGIFGFVLGGNFAADGISSCGCSGSLFGILAITLLDLLYTWRQRRSPIRDLAFILLDVVIAFILGLLPGLDNFSHIGGFAMGLVLGVCILRSPTAISQRRSTTAEDLYPSSTNNKNRRTRTPYMTTRNGTSTSSGSATHDLKASISSPRTFFTDRQPMWWAWWVLRVLALIGALVAFICLLKNFYVWGVTCSWCKYLSCLPVTVDGSNWCTEGTLDFQTNNATSSSKRDLILMGLLR